MTKLEELKAAYDAAAYAAACSIFAARGADYEAACNIARDAARAAYESELNKETSDD